MRAVHRNFLLRILLLFVFELVAGLTGWAQVSQGQLTTLQQLTQSLISQGSGGGSAQQTTEVARQRHDLLLTLAAQSAQAVIPYLLPASAAANLPSSAQAYVETDAYVSGQLEVAIEDYGQMHKTRYFLHTTTERLEIYFATVSPPHLSTGSRISVAAKRIDNFLLLQIGTPNDGDAATPSETSAISNMVVLSLATTNTFGPQRTAVVLVNFFDDMSTPFSVDEVRQTVFTSPGSVNSFMLENSQNQTMLAGDVFGWFTMPNVSVASCPTDLSGPAQQAAGAAGVDLSSYSRFIYIFPQNGCSWLGESTVGGNPSQAFINGILSTQVIGHEFGHSLGLFHSHALDCGSTTLGDHCTPIEYGDLFDIMGDVTASHFNGFQKELLGWLNYGVSQPIQTVTAGGDYTITPYESGPGVKALKILQNADTSGATTSYYVEYRQLLGFDQGLSAYPASTAGVLIHTGSNVDRNGSFLLNMNPPAPFDHAALAVGQSFVDTTAGVVIKTKSADANGAVVNVQFGPGGCVNAAPLISVSPAQAPPASAGATRSFTVSVTNQDTAGCTGFTFLVNGIPPGTPAGWSAVSVPSSLKLDPGATGTTTLQVTSPAGAPAGMYTVTVTAVKWPAYIYNASASATYQVSSGAAPDFGITAPPSVTIQQGSSAPLTIGSTVSDGFSSPVSLSISGLPPGVTASFNPSTFPAPGSGSSTVTLTVNSAVVTGTYKLMISGSGGGVMHSAAISLTVSAVPPPPPPPPPPGNSFSLFSPSASPALPNANAGAPLELGTKFTSDSNGYITGIRFYKGSSNTGTHVGSLWTRGGQLLAQVTFTNETESGWQQANFAAPMAIMANTIYVVSYHTPGPYSYDAVYFNSPVDNPPLHAVLNSTSSNGVYSFGAAGTFPTSSVGGANFWVDVVFSTGTSTGSLVSIAVTPATPSIAVGSTQPFHATGSYTDGTMRDISGQVIWDSATPAVATINSSGVATGVSPGTSQITAMLGAISGQATLTVSSAPPPSGATTLFSSTATPAVLDGYAGSPLEMGMLFTTDHDGTISGVRFYKAASNTGAHVGSLWNSSGQLLARVTFDSETASGWQQANFGGPVAITANTVYIVSYHSSGHFSYTLGYFNTAIDNPPLHAVRNGASGNGVYWFGANPVFPSIGAAGQNFWVDVVFQP